MIGIVLQQHRKESGVDHEKKVTLSAPLLAPLRHLPSRTRHTSLGIERLALPVGKRGLGSRRRGRVDVHPAVLDHVDEVPAVGGNACVEADVNVSFADVAAEDKRGAGLLRGRVAVAQYVEQYA